MLYERLQKGFNEHTESMNHLRRQGGLSLSFAAPSVDSQTIIHLQIIRVRVLRACAFLIVDSLNEQRVSLS